MLRENIVTHHFFLFPKIPLEKMGFADRPPGVANLQVVLFEHLVGFLLLVARISRYVPGECFMTFFAWKGCFVGLKFQNDVR